MQAQREKYPLFGLSYSLMKDVKCAQRPWISLHDLQTIIHLHKRVEFAKHKRMGDTEDTRKRAAVMGDILLGGNDQRRLHGGQPRILGLQIRDQREKPLGFIRIVAHAASRLRNDTMIDLDVGVSLSSPALPSGTRTLSSG